jgi:ABC-type phosphate transport system substrate-binding protein
MRAHRGSLPSAVLAVAGVIAAAAGLVLAAAPAQASTRTYAAIEGSGSAWASVPVEQWAQNVRGDGLIVNFNPDGTPAGLEDYLAGQTEFAVSDLPFGVGHNRFSQAPAVARPVGYSYVPIVAGGTALVYHTEVGGRLVRNLRLTPQTIFAIFTGAITNWDSPQITRDDGFQLPDLPIIPVVRSDEAGPTYFFTNWLATLFPRQWNAFCTRTQPRLALPCGPTAYYPRLPGSRREDGSNDVVTYIMSAAGNGAIGYDETAYALVAHAPVASVRNPDGRYVQPTARDVSIALTKAQVNTNPRSAQFGQENLRAVYADRNPRSYPLSSYAYLIVPRTGSRLPPEFTTAEGTTLSVYADYAVCRGQREASELGDAPLPVNLVREALREIALIPGHVRKPPSFTGCG